MSSRLALACNAGNWPNPNDAPLVLGIYITHAYKPLTIQPHEFIDFTAGRGNRSARCKDSHPVSMIAGMVFVDEFNMGIRHNVKHALHLLAALIVGIQLLPGIRNHFLQGFPSFDSGRALTELAIRRKQRSVRLCIA